LCLPTRGLRSRLSQHREIKDMQTNAIPASAPGNRAPQCRAVLLLMLAPWLGGCDAAGTICSQASGSLEQTICDGTSTDTGSLTGVPYSDNGLSLDMGLNDKSLSGIVPSQLGLLTALKGLELKRNDLSGSLPSQLGLLTAMTLLSAYGNDLSGSLPSQLGLLTAMTYLSLYDMKNGGLSGYVPSQLGLLTALTTVLLRSPERQLGLSGSLPSQLGRLTALTDLNLYNNHLSGSVPSQLGMLTALPGLKMCVW